MGILLVALLVVVFMVIVVKPAITGKTPDISLPSFFGRGPEPASPAPLPRDTLPPKSDTATPTRTPGPGVTWDGSPVTLWYVLAGTPVPPPPPDVPKDGSGQFGPGTTPAEPTPGPLAASFSATPRDGPVPLPVRFTDTSTGIPDRWEWSFGDGTTSTLGGPLHTYTQAGTYQVSLTVANAYGGNTRIHEDYITVREAGVKEIVVDAGRGAMVIPGGFIECTVTGPGSRIRIGGLVRDLPPGTRIRLVVEEPGKGKIAVEGGSIQEYSFDHATLYINGTYAQQGAARQIQVFGYDTLISSLELDIGEGDGQIRVLEGGVPVVFTGNSSSLSLTSLRPDSSGVMILDCYRLDSTFFQGAVTSYRSTP